MTSQEIKDLLQYGEHVNLECKEGSNTVPKSVWETYSSFANTSGGTILLGIKENMHAKNIKDRFEITGIQNPNQRVKDFWDTINSNKVSFNILFDKNVGIEQIENASIIWIQVPEANYQHKPVYINENPLRGSYKRNHEGDYHCTEQEVKAMLRDASSSGSDGMILEGYTIDDIDIPTLKAYRIEYERQNPDQIWNSSDDKEFLRNLGAYGKDRKTQKEGLTVAGLLMFGKGLSIRERFDNIRMDYLDYTNLAPESRWSDRITYDGSWENNLYNFFRRVMPKLVQDLKRPFSMEGIVRVDTTLVHTALREAFVNMLVHSDYHSHGILKIEKQDDGFIFSNPGNLMIPAKAIYEGGHSYARNPRIQALFRMIGLGENIGSGFPTILKAWENEKWREPDLYEDTESRRIDLRLWMVSFIPNECSKQLKQIFGETYQQLSKEEQTILMITQQEKSVSNHRLQSVFHMHPTEIGKLLQNLVDKNFLIQSSKNRWTFYILNTDFKKAKIQAPEILGLSLNATDQEIIEFLLRNGTITTKDIVTSVDSINTSQGALIAIKRLMDTGLVKRQRNGRHIYYMIDSNFFSS